jgi:hypothetical protein
MMNWEQKKDLAKAINTLNYKKIDEFVDKYIEDFDCQTWDMLACMPIIRNNYSEETFVKIKNNYKKAYNSGLLDNLSMRSAIRLEMAFGEDDD